MMMNANGKIFYYSSPRDHRGHIEIFGSMIYLMWINPRLHENYRSLKKNRLILTHYMEISNIKMLTKCCLIFNSKVKH